MPTKPPTLALNKPALPPTCQTDFHRRWGHLRDPHVRALAWLLTAPNLLDTQAEQWRGMIASLDGAMDQATFNWLAALDAAPTELHAFLDIRPSTRLGHYAEELLAFYFRRQGILFAHGLQVRASKGDTVGEFDFLLWHKTGPASAYESALLHWEFATKFYLLESSAAGAGSKITADYFVGPNLADTLGAKMRKILDRQLMLGQHPAAQIHLPQPVASDQALIKGWLFYHGDDALLPPAIGLSPAHCRGFWCSLTEFEAMPAERLAILPRLSWLAPARVSPFAALDKPQLQDALAAQFSHTTMPVLVALLQQHGDQNCLLETSRGFIVPDDWRSKAQQYSQPGV
ncbi:MAG: DUF1853 family protein [Glaciimonas sp.]|nr:DUF1853 family protein [Glaciimonas sp.]